MRSHQRLTAACQFRAWHLAAICGQSEHGWSIQPAIFYTIPRVKGGGATSAYRQF